MCYVHTMKKCHKLVFVITLFMITSDIGFNKNANEMENEWQKEVLFTLGFVYTTQNLLAEIDFTSYLINNSTFFLFFSLFCCNFWVII